MIFMYCVVSNGAPLSPVLLAAALAWLSPPS